MSVYVDCLASYGWTLRGHVVKSCHMFTDGDLSELHDMAKFIGMKREWFQGGTLPHYDLTASRRAHAVLLGAVEVDRRETVRHIRNHREGSVERAE